MGFLRRLLNDDGSASRYMVEAPEMKRCGPTCPAHGQPQPPKKGRATNRYSTRNAR